MASDAQVDLIEDLMDVHGFDRDDLAFEDETWYEYESLPSRAASELVYWLKDAD